MKTLKQNLVDFRNLFTDTDALIPTDEQMLDVDAEKYEQDGEFIKEIEETNRDIDEIEYKLDTRIYNTAEKYKAEKRLEELKCKLTDLEDRRANFHLNLC